MLRSALLSLTLLISLSSASLLRKSVARRQNEAEYCQAIEGFDCKCTHYRIICTSDRDLPASINVLSDEKGKYQTVELVLNSEGVQNVYDYTFESVKQLYKPEVDIVEFRIKFEKFSELHLSSPSIFNRVFPDNLSSNVRKIMALEVYNPLVQPNDNVNLFANLNVDALEVYLLYPPRGTFQQLFNGANIKYLRLSGGDIRSDLSQPFTGNIGRLELAKQASQLSVQNFPAYPAHELIINAFYVTDFNSEHPPNYSNLGELRVHSPERIPANAFRQYPNIHTLSITTEKDIDGHALEGLQNLEKLTINNAKPSSELLNSLPNLKEFETSLDKFSEREQCDLVEKLANGQMVVQAVSHNYECTCVSAYLDTAVGRYACEPQNCEQSSCPAIKNNFDASLRTFKAPPPIKRADGSDALRPREVKTYSTTYQVPSQDQEKSRRGTPQHAQSSSGQDADGNHPDSHSEHHGVDEHSGHASDSSQSTQPRPLGPEGYDGEGGKNAEDDENQEGGDGHGSHKDNEGGDDKDAEGNQDGASQTDSSSNVEGVTSDNSTITDASAPTKKGFSWLPIIIIIAAVVALILLGLIFFIVRKRNRDQAYNRAPTSENSAGAAAKA